jgi:hypothetical protein
MNMKKQLRETECVDVNWGYLVQHMDLWQTGVKTEM